jgi:xylulokinase
MTRLVLGIDSSTTACKAIAWDASGRPVAEGRASLALVNPGPGAYEQDPEALWGSLVEAVRALISRLGAEVDSIEALCVVHQRETFVLADEGGRPLAPALVWMDARCVEDVARASRDLGVDFIHTTTGKFPCTTPSFYKLLGLLRRRPELGGLRPYFLDVHGFLMRRLVGEFVTSRASADPLGVVAMERGEYCRELLDYAGVEAGRVARLVGPGSVVGGLTEGAARELGLRAGLPVVAGAGDGQAAGLGAGAVGSRGYLNLGTAVVCGRLSAGYRVDRGYRTLFGASPGSYFLEGDLKAGTFLVSWLLGTLLGLPAEGRDEALRRLDGEAGALGPGAGGLVLLPYWNGVMNPYWDDRATGALVGLRGDHGPAHLLRAAQEGIAMEVRLHLEGLEQAGPVEELVAVGGGARSDQFCQVVADVTGRPVLRHGSAEATCLGAGVLAAAAVGLHPSLDAAVEGMVGRAERLEPGPSRGYYEGLFEGVYRGLYPALARAMAGLARLSGAQ